MRIVLAYDDLDDVLVQSDEDFAATMMSKTKVRPWTIIFFFADIDTEV